MSAPAATPSRPTDSRRTSTLQKRASLLPKPSTITLDSTVLIAQHAQLTGTHAITIGPQTVLHPHSKLSSAQAPVVLGPGVIIYERAKVGVGMGDGSDASAGLDSKRGSRFGMGSRRTSGIDKRGEGTVLGKNVVVETNAIVEAAEVGEGSVVEVSAHLGRGCVIGKYCTVGAGCVVAAGAQVPDYTVLYGVAERRTDKTLQSRPEVQEMRAAFHAKQLDAFKKLLPNNVAKWS
jgi:dynactin-6